MVTVPEQKLIPGSVNVPPADLPKIFESRSGPVSPKQAAEVGQTFVAHFSAKLIAGEYDGLCKFFLPDNCYYRDMLVTSPDVRSLHGFEKIQQYLSAGRTIQSLEIDGMKSAPALEPLNPGLSVNCITVFLTGETDIAYFRGLAKLVQDVDDEGRWKIYFINTLVTMWKGLLKEHVGPNRPFGGELTAKDPEPEPSQLTASDAAVLIVGAGHCGLNTAARLAALGVKALLVDRLPRVGDVWRNRYDTLSTHDPVHSNHMAYLNFPPTWPLYATKDDMGSWLDAYVQIMGLEVLTNTTIKRPIWHPSKKQWSVTISRTQDGVVIEQAIHPRHIIQSTGFAGGPNVPDIQGLTKFRGPLIHSAAFRNAKGSKGKKVVIVGACNSAQDAARDYLLNGADVTIIQRSSTSITTRDIVTPILARSYNEGNLNQIDEFDYLRNMVPLPVLKTFSIQANKILAPLLKPVEEDYRSAGFQLNDGPDGAGILFLALQSNGGYHIYEGNHKYYREGRMKVQQGKQIAEITEASVVLEDGTTIEADEIVMATGYKSRESVMRSVFGDDVANKVHGFGGLNSDGEWMTEWRQSGCPGFWVTIGNMAMSRFWSRILALQIQALEGGLYEIW